MGCTPRPARTVGNNSVLRLRRASLATIFLPRGIAAMIGPQDAGLVGTPYFWVGITAAVGLWATVMLALWI